MMVWLEVPATAKRGQHGVYVIFDDAGDPLYIGRTKNLLARLKQHRWHSDWWTQSRSLEFTPCADAVEARLVERDLIATFKPDANIVDWVVLRPGKQVLPEWAVANLRDLYSQSLAAGGRDTEADDLFNAYIVDLRLRGWGLAEIGHPLGWTREAIRLRTLRPSRVENTLTVPDVPRLVTVEKPRGLPRRSVPLTVLARMKELHAVARRVNGATPADDPARVASVELTELIAEQYLRGVGLSRIAKQLGVTNNAVRVRLSYHGYIDAEPSLGARQYIGRPRDATPNNRCAHGHDLVGENVRLINGDPRRRACRACERRRSAAYKQRKAAASP